MLKKNKNISLHGGSSKTETESVWIIWLHTDVSSIRGQAYMLANRATLTDSYTINQTEALYYRDTMRQFIVHAICYHDSTPALMQDVTHNAHKCKDSRHQNSPFQSSCNLTLILIFEAKTEPTEAGDVICHTHNILSISHQLANLLKNLLANLNPC